MFRTVPLSIIRSFALYTQQWYMSYRFADCLRAGSGWSSILILLASCHQTRMTYTITVCTVKNSWWCTEKLSETCRVLLQKQIWEISTSSWFYYKKWSWWTVIWTSNTRFFPSPKYPYWLWSPPSLVFIENRGFFHREWRAWRIKLEHSPKCSAQVKNELDCTSIPHICLHGVSKENLLLVFIQRIT